MMLSRVLWWLQCCGGICFAVAAEWPEPMSAAKREEPPEEPFLHVTILLMATKKPQRKPSSREMDIIICDGRSKENGLWLFFLLCLLDSCEDGGLEAAPGLDRLRMLIGRRYRRFGEEGVDRQLLT
jgi:hypothetical protein